MLESFCCIFEFGDNEETVECRPEWPTSHECELFTGCVSTERRYMSWFHYELVFDDIDEFLLLEVDDDFITICELIEQSKYIIVGSFCPWKV